MTLSSAYNIVSSSFASTAAQSAIIARNISNANTPGYSREIANQITNAYGGSDVASVSRVANAALLDQLNVSTSESASQGAISAGLATLAQTVDDSASASSSTGPTENGNSPSALMGNLQSALATYAASPSSEAAGQAAVTAAGQLASSLNAGAAAVQQVRSQADADMATSVASINSLLSQFSAANSTIVNGLAAGTDVTAAQDQSDSLLTQISQQVGISTTTNANGSTSIYTDSGVLLFQNIPQTLTFQPSGALASGVAGNAVMVNGVPLTGANAPMAAQSGALAGYAQLRDTIAPAYGAQLDQIAGGLVSAFAEAPGTTGSTAPTLPGLFTYPGATGVPTTGAMTGLASEIEINPNVDPAQGGDVDLLRDGGIASPGASTYTYNTTGAADYSTRISQLMNATSVDQSFNSAVGLGASGTLASYASASVAWLQGQNSQASDAASYQSSVVSQASSALSNATGVNLDTEMTNMLNIENSYTTSSKLLTTVTAMFTALIDAA
jgi:flagellar hook-associated protein 1 FlgK